MMHTRGAILLVEDNDDDVILIRRALQKGGVTAPVTVVRDGQQAVDYLAGNGLYTDTALFPLPFVMLLDLKLPRKSGLEVLEWVRSHATLGTLPIVVFTTSTLETDLRAAYGLGANSYLKKPGTVAETTELLRAVGSYWLQHNQQPPALHRGTA